MGCCSSTNHYRREVPNAHIHTRDESVDQSCATDVRWREIDEPARRVRDVDGGVVGTRRVGDRARDRSVAIRELTGDLRRGGVVAYVGLLQHVAPLVVDTIVQAKVRCDLYTARERASEREISQRSLVS